MQRLTHITANPFGRILLCLTITILLSGCAQTLSQVVPFKVYSIKNDQNTLAEEGYGYLLMAVKTNQTIQELHMDGPMNIILTHKDLKRGSNYILLSLPQGEYNISKIRVSLTKSTMDDDDYWNFNVKANTISYIGDLNAQITGWFGARQKYELVNRSSYALEYMESEYPQLLSRNTLVYSGYGNDIFLERMTQKAPPTPVVEPTTQGISPSATAGVE